MIEEVKEEDNLSKEKIKDN